MDGYDWKRWGLQVAIAFDQFLNVLVTPGSATAYADETLSSRAWRMCAKRRPWGRVMKPLIDWLLRAFDGADHCQRSHTATVERVRVRPDDRE